MAGDWIPMRLDLAEDPAVIQVAHATGLDEFGVVGRLHRLWSWANRQSRDGHAPGVTEKWIDVQVGVTGFAIALSEAGWLEVTPGGVNFPKFEEWNSKGAKRRVLAAKRQSRKRHAPVTLPAQQKRDQRREEKSKEETPLTPPFESPAFAAAWASWEQHRREIGKPLKPTSVRKQFAKLAAMGEGRAVRALDHSTANGYQGIYEPTGVNGRAGSEDPAMRYARQGAEAMANAGE